MQKKLLNFAAMLNFDLSEKAAQTLCQYADFVWQKKEMLNLTSVSDKNEIITRHICDGLAGAAFLKQCTLQNPISTLADMGSGAGYIGLTMAIALPQVKVSLIESLERRCMFLNWVIMKLGLQNVTVLNVRLGQQTVGPFDMVTERAMGQLRDILPLLAGAAQENGVITAYQSQIDPSTVADIATQQALQVAESWIYRLPEENKKRYLAVFKKHGYC